MAELLPLLSRGELTRRGYQAERTMKSVTKRPEGRARELEPSGRSEKRFRFPASEQISEISCPTDSERWAESVQPGEFDGPDVRISLDSLS